MRRAPPCRRRRGRGRDWAQLPAVVDRTTSEEIVALGDVHGAYDRLVHILQVGGIARADAKAKGGYAWAGGKRTLVSVGDLIDKGPQSLEVLDLMMSLQAGARAAGGDVIVTLGNHEAEFLARPGRRRRRRSSRRSWRRGASTSTTSRRAATTTGDSCAACPWPRA